MSKYTKTMRQALAEMSEAFSQKQIKMAIGIASDKRYAGGNMTGAVKQIEKLKRGLSDHPQVAAVLKRQNEMYDSDAEHTKDPKSHVKLNKETGKYCVYDMKDKKVAEFDTKDEAEAYSIKNHDALMNEQQLDYGSIDEGRMKELHGYIAKGMSAEDIAKKMKLDLKTIKSLMKEETEQEECACCEETPCVCEDDCECKSLGEMAYKPGSFKDTRPQEKAAKALDGIIKTGGLDKKDFQKARALYVQASDAGSREKLKKFIGNLDTDPLETILDIIGKNDPQTFQQMYPKSKPGQMLSTIAYNHRSVKSENINEAKFSDGMIDKLKKAYEPMKGKKINPTPLMKIFDKIDSNKNGLEQLYKADIPFVSMMAMSRLMLKHNYKADDINKLGKIRREDFVLDRAINEAVNYNFAAVDKKGKVIGFSSKESDAKDMARRNKGRVVTLTKPLAPKKGDMMVNRPFPDEMDKFPTNTSATQGKRMEEVELDERKFEAGKSASGYDIFHKDFSSAMQHATAFAKKKGQPIKKDEIDSKVATGPKKPSSGKENSYTLETEKGKMWSVQVYNMGSKFELNMYLTSSHVPEGEELDEGMKMNDPKLLKMFDKLKKGSKIKLKTSSTISQGKDYVEYIVKSKNTVNKGKVEKITLATVGNEKAVKKYLYKRDGTVGFAIGDMGASIDDIKESTNEVPENMAAYLAAITKQLGER